MIPVLQAEESLRAVRCAAIAAGTMPEPLARAQLQDWERVRTRGAASVGLAPTTPRGLVQRLSGVSGIGMRKAAAARPAAPEAAG